MNCRPTVLIILDGFGINPDPQHNAVAQANTPHLDALFRDHAYTTLQASGAAVGLPDGQMGNSEVGHAIMGCGNIVLQDLVRIDHSIESGEFYRNPVLLEATRHAAKNGRLHLLGLTSNGGVHSHLNHLLALIELTRREGVAPHVHMITDGRDTPPRQALEALTEVERALAETEGTIDTVSGRYYAMDRDRRWERTQRAFEAIARGAGTPAADARAAIEAAYAAGTDDEFIPPAVCPGAQALGPDDAMIFFNFRNESTATVGGKSVRFYIHGVRAWRLQPGATDHHDAIRLGVRHAHRIHRRGAGMLAGRTDQPTGHRTVRCAETEKYPHVTFFFNGGRESPWPGEQRVMLPSPDVATYDECPQMSAEGVADAVLDSLRSEQYGFVLVNFANADMVGHTAQPEAIIAAVEELDRQVGRLVEAAQAQGVTLMLTADHGNCDQMVDADNRPHTQHTTHPVPCVVMDSVPRRLRNNGGLGNVAPTVLELMGLECPDAMLPSLLLN